MFFFGNRRGRHADDHIIHPGEKQDDEKDKERHGRPAVEKEKNYSCSSESNEGIGLCVGDNSCDYFGSIHVSSFIVCYYKRSGNVFRVLLPPGRDLHDKPEIRSCIGYNIATGTSERYFSYEESRFSRFWSLLP